jgi:CBS domain containing-hemolysin-like protein
MEGDGLAIWLLSLALILMNALFVAAEYGLVGARRARIEAKARHGNRAAKALIAAYDDLASNVAGIQIAITMLGIGLGAITEPVVTAWISGLIGAYVGGGVSVLLSLVIVTYAVVVLGELVPKYVTLRHPEGVALALVRPLAFVVTGLRPLVWLVKRSGAIAVRPFGIKVDDAVSEAVTREDLALLLRAGAAEGLEEEHARVLAKALRFDKLDAADIMVHRLDIRWLDAATPRHELLTELGKIPHSRIPVCRGDIDDVIGILYLQDVVKHWHDETVSLDQLLRPVEAVPENLSLNRVVNRMRDAKTQILLVLDEYGGTSGLITLEDVIEEVFGEMEDQLESERPPIERMSSHRISARAEVRFDELVEFLGVELSEPPSTDTLATLVVNSLGRVPRLGDTVMTAVGRLRVENMARRRITRVSLTHERGAP